MESDVWMTGEGSSLCTTTRTTVLCSETFEFVYVSNIKDRQRPLSTFPVVRKWFIPKAFRKNMILQRWLTWGNAAAAAAVPFSDQMPFHFLLPSLAWGSMAVLAPSAIKSFQVSASCHEILWPLYMSMCCCFRVLWTWFKSIWREMWRLQGRWWWFFQTGSCISGAAAAVRLWSLLPVFSSAAVSGGKANWQVFYCCRKLLHYPKDQVLINTNLGRERERDRREKRGWKFDYVRRKESFFENICIRREMEGEGFGKKIGISFLVTSTLYLAWQFAFSPAECWGLTKFS